MSTVTPSPSQVTIEQVRNLAAPPPQQAVEITLDMIVNEGFKIDPSLPGDTPVLVKPLNLRGYAMLTKKFGSLADMPDVGNDVAAMLEVVAVLVNQDRPLDKQQSTEEIAARISAHNLPILDKIIGEQIRPFLSRLATEMNRARETAKQSPAPTGPASLGSP